MAMPVTVTLSSAGTAQIACDYLKGTPIGVTITTSGVGAGSSQTVFTVQLTLDDLTNTVSSGGGIPPARTVTWVNDPNFTVIGTSIQNLSSGVILYQQPLGGIRLNSTTSSGVTITMKMNQGLW